MIQRSPKRLTAICVNWRKDGPLASGKGVTTVGRYDWLFNEVHVGRLKCADHRPGCHVEDGNLFFEYHLSVVDPIDKPPPVRRNGCFARSPIALRGGNLSTDTFIFFWIPKDDGVVIAGVSGQQRSLRI